MRDFLLMKNIGLVDGLESSGSFQGLDSLIDMEVAFFSDREIFLQSDVFVRSENFAKLVNSPDVKFAFSFFAARSGTRSQ